jgi:hypothetical protein
MSYSGWHVAEFKLGALKSSVLETPNMYNANAPVGLFRRLFLFRGVQS